MEWRQCLSVSCWTSKLFNPIYITMSEYYWLWFFVLKTKNFPMYTRKQNKGDNLGCVCWLVHKCSGKHSCQGQQKLYSEVLRWSLNMKVKIENAHQSLLWQVLIFYSTLIFHEHSFCCDNKYSEKRWGTKVDNRQLKECLPTFTLTVAHFTTSVWLS